MTQPRHSKRKKKGQGLTVRLNDTKTGKQVVVFLFSHCLNRSPGTGEFCVIQEEEGGMGEALMIETALITTECKTSLPHEMSQL